MHHHDYTGGDSSRKAPTPSRESWSHPTSMTSISMSKGSVIMIPALADCDDLVCVLTKRQPLTQHARYNPLIIIFKLNSERKLRKHSQAWASTPKYCQTEWKHSFDFKRMHSTHPVHRVHSFTSITSTKRRCTRLVLEMHPASWTISMHTFLRSKSRRRLLHVSLR